MNIKTEYVCMGMWVADDEDGDAEAGIRGTGSSPDAAINNLVDQLIDRAEDHAYAEGRKDEAEESKKALSDLRKSNELLVRWKGEIDSHLIARGIEFPADYQDSPKWAVAKLLGRI